MTEKQMYDFLKSNGLTDAGVSGVFGNLFYESGLIPINVQNTYEKSLGMNDAQYTAAVDSGDYDNFVYDKAGYGLAQWTFWSRKKALLEFARDTKRSIGDAQMQLEFLLKELAQGYKKLLDVLKSSNSVEECCEKFLLEFEKPANATSHKDRRNKKALEYHNKYVSCEDSKSTQDNMSSLYKVQAGAFFDKKNANDVVSSLKLRGVSSLIVKSGDLYKVQAGAFRDRKNADAMVAKLKGFGFDCFVTNKL